MKNIISPMQMTEKQKRHLMRLAEIADEGDAAIIKRVFQLEDKIDEEIPKLTEKLDIATKTLENKVDEALKIVSETSKQAGPTGMAGKDGIDAKPYIPTEKDLNNIASRVNIPIIEKVIVEKKVEIIKEIPIVRETVKETIKEDLAPQEVRDRLELLSGEERLDAKYVKNLPEAIKFPSYPNPGLSNLPDVSVTGATSGQVLTWNGIYWYPATTSGGVGSWSTPVETPLPDGSVTQYTVGTSAPTDVCSDGIMLFSGQGYTYSSPKITFTNGPAQYVRYR